MAQPTKKKRYLPPRLMSPYLTTSAKTSYRYVVVRYDEVRDDGTRQPRRQATLGREGQVDPAKAGTLTNVLRELVRKDSTMTVAELKELLGMVKPALRIRCSRQFGLRVLVEQAFKQRCEIREERHELISVIDTKRRFASSPSKRHHATSGYRRA